MVMPYAGIAEARYIAPIAKMAVMVRMVTKPLILSAFLERLLA